MSHTYYTELWLVVRSDLEKLLKLERKLQEDGSKKKKTVLNALLSMYLRYKIFYVAYNTIL